MVSELNTGHGGYINEQQTKQNIRGLRYYYDKKYRKQHSFTLKPTKSINVNIIHR